MGLTASLIAIRMQLTGSKEVVAGATEASAAIKGTGIASAEANAGQAAGARSAAKYTGALQMLGKAAAFAGGGLALIGGFVIKDAIQGTEELAKSTQALQNITDMDARSSAQWVQVTQARGEEASTLNSGMLALTKNIVAARKGTTAQVSMFEKLGIAQEDLNKMDTDQTIMAISDALSGMEDPQREAAIATSLFGKAGLKMYPLLKGGAASLQETLGRFHGLSETEKTDAQASVKAQQRLTRIWDDFQITLGTKVMPEVTKIVKGLGDMFEKAKHDGTINDLKDTLNDLWGTMKDGISMTDSVAKALGGLDGVVKAAIVGLSTKSMLSSAREAGRPIGASLAKGLALGVVLFLPDALEAISPKITDTLYDFFRNSTPLGLIDDTLGTDITGTIFGGAGDRASRAENHIQQLDSEPRRGDGGHGSSNGKRKQAATRTMPRLALPSGASGMLGGGDLTVPVYLDGRLVAESTARHAETSKARR